MTDQEILRIDKFLWAVRIFKTRTQAAEACAKGHVLIDGMTVKPSRHIKEGEKLIVKKPPMEFRYTILRPLHTRLSAEKVKEYLEDNTPQDSFQKLELLKLQKNAIRDRGTGRPTKKDRRDIDKHIGLPSKIPSISFFFSNLF